MAIVSTLDVCPFPDMSDMNWTGSSGSSFTFDGSADMFAVIFHIPATGTIDNIHYRVNAVTSPSLTLRIELRTVDATTGQPNAAGTLYGSSTSITVANPTTGNKTAAVACTGATAGDLVALVFDLSAYTSGSFTVNQRISGQPLVQGVFPYQASNTSGSTSLIALNANAVAFEYANATYYRMEWSTITAQNITQPTVTNSGVTRRGNLIRSTVPRRAVGVWISGDLDGDCYLRLRLFTNDSILATATMDKDIRGLTTLGLSYVFFDAKATYNLVAGTDYYVLLEGNSATTCSINLLSSIPANAQLGQLSGGANCYGTSYNSGYTDVNTSRYAIGILYDGLDDGTGVSGLSAIGHAG